MHLIDNHKDNNETMNLALITTAEQYQCPITKATLAKTKHKRMTKDDIIAIKSNWKDWEGSKGEFYNKWADRLGFGTSSIQDIIIGFSHKNVEVD